MTKMGKAVPSFFCKPPVTYALSVRNILDARQTVANGCGGCEPNCEQGPFIFHSGMIFAPAERMTFRVARIRLKPSLLAFDVPSLTPVFSCVSIFVMTDSRFFVLAPVH